MNQVYDERTPGEEFVENPESSQTKQNVSYDNSELDLPLPEIEMRTSSLFNCSYCEKIFCHKTHLKDHERIHTGEKPFPCKFCTRPFSTKTNCKTHEKRCAKKNPLLVTAYEAKLAGKNLVQCKRCTLEFASIEDLKTHFITCRKVFNDTSTETSMISHTRTHLSNSKDEEVEEMAGHSNMNQYSDEEYDDFDYDETDVSLPIYYHYY